MIPLIANRDARRLFLHLQGLSGAPGRRQNIDDLQQLIHQLGFVQVDSINTVERAHHMILFSRNQTYQPENLRVLLEDRRGLFENWTHDAAIIPSAFYPYWQTRFERERKRLLARWRTWRREGFEAVFDDVRHHIEHHGPAMARDFSNRRTANETSTGKAGNETTGGQGWWDWHPAKTALEFLWRTGELAVAGRRGFQKIYDLSDRVIPADHRVGPADQEALVEWACAGALARLGMASHGELAAFWAVVGPAEAAAWCAGEIAAGRLQNVLVESADGSPPKKALARPDIVTRLAMAPEAPARLRVLSPFDPVLRDRKRALRLFNFDYRIEVFVPAAQRRYGYYVFPLLQGERMVGRLDMKHFRNDRQGGKQAGKLVVKGVWWEASVKSGKGRVKQLEAELERMRRFTGANELVIEAPLG